MLRRNQGYHGVVETKSEDQARIDRDLEALRTSLVQQRENVDELLAALRDLFDRIPTENLR
jgi:hypothetical protein